MGIRMLRITQQSNAEAAKRYHSSPSEYYAGGEQEIVGIWGGKTAERLGLAGEVLRPHFERLCDNRDPFTGDQLTARMRKDRRVGYDFTFNACKSVSIVYGLTEDPAILDAFRRAAREVMRHMERGVKVRVRKRGQYGERAAGNLAFAEYLHFTARPVRGKIDPHLHGHYFVPNVCWDPVERMYKAIDVASVKEGAPHWQAMFQRRFGRELEASGFVVAWKGDSFELAGVGRPLIEKFSGRTLHINRVAEQRGIADEAAKAELGARTREGKRKDLPLPQLRAEWRERLTDDDRAALAQAALRRRHNVPADRQARTVHDGQAGTMTTLQRQRLAAHQRACASYAISPPRLSVGHAR